MKSESGIPVVEQRPEGFVLVDASDTPAAALATMGFSGCFVFIPMLVFGIILLGAGATGSSGPGLIAGFIAFVFVLIGVAIFRTGLKKFRIAQRWEPGELVSPSWPIVLGEAVELRFRRRALTADRAAVTLIGRLVLRESVTYRQGTDTRTVTEDVAEYPLDVAMGPPGSPDVEASMAVTIPRDAPASFELKNNRLQWWVLLDPVSEGDDSQFKLWVRPGQVS